MANTVIQLKYSTVTDIPASLNIAEPAYSYTSNTLFIGSPDGNGSIAIGGRFYLDQQQIIYNYANAAFATANAAGSSALVTYAANTANAAFAHANASFEAANSAGSYANSAFATANNEAGVNLTQNNSITAAFTAANSAGVYANAAFDAANAATATDTTQNNSITAAFTAANSAGVYANGAFARANNSLDANNGGTITGSLTINGGDLTVTGNLIVNGNTTTQNVTTLNIADPLIYLAANNYASDAVDIGWVGNYYDSGTSTQRHAGVFRDSGTKEFYIFNNYDKEPDNNLIDTGDASFRVATVNANLKSQLITLNGQNLQTYVDNAYNTANAAFASANNEAGVNLTQNNSIAAAFTAANSAGSYANSAFGVANTASDAATSAGIYANGAFTKANSAQNHAEAAFSLANGTAVIANTDYTNISISGGDYGSASAVAAFKVEANGRISSANSTAIAISAAAITSGTLGVARGGTGAGSFTNNGVLLGQGTSAFSTASSSTEGHVLTINASGVPTFAHLQGGTF